jgi:NADP-dependent 3-hydroxy acid dehydrogenase YdfG
VIVLVTGASGGFGGVLARTLVAKGLTVYGTMRSPEKSAPDLPFTMLAMEVTDSGSVEE